MLIIVTKESISLENEAQYSSEKAQNASMT